MTTNIIIRRLNSSDSLEELTLLLNRSYATLADMGLRYTATYQDVAITRDRIAKGICLLAEVGGSCVGSITYFPPGALTYQYYGEHPEEAVFGQLGVEPEFRRQGVGEALIAFAEAQARSDQAAAISLDTAVPAVHLISWYKKLGYLIVGEANWESTNYQSVIMSKRLL